MDLSGTKASDLTPLKGMPLTILNLIRCSDVHDLTPLKGMPLTILQLQETQVTDLTPLKGMKISVIECQLGKITNGLAVLREMSSLTKVGGGLAAAEFWKKYDAGAFR